jgi:hypothetical protein
MGFKLMPTSTHRLGRLAFGAGKIALGLFFFANSTFLPQAQALVAVSTSSKTAEGVRVTSFETANGKLVVFLPEDMQATDLISSTIELEPKGNSEIELKQNKAELSKYIFELREFTSADSTKESPISQSVNFTSIQNNHLTFPLAIPEKCTKIVLALRNAQGEEIAVRTFLLEAKPGQSALAPDMCYVPASTQSGHIATIGMINDGKLDDFFATIGSATNTLSCQNVAASPRAIFIRTPRTLVGQLELKITKGDKMVKTKVNNLEVNVTCPKSTMQKGEQTELIVTVRGLAGLAAPVKLTLENRTPQVVQMSGGDTQTFTIPGRKPGEDQAMKNQDEVKDKDNKDNQDQKIENKANQK